MFYNRFYLIIPILFICLLSCDRPKCETDNAVFLNNSYDSEVYKAELANQITQIGQNNLRYWLKDYVESKTDFLVFYVQNDSLCANIKITINNWKNLEQFKKTNGKGRFNAEFKGLNYKIVQENNQTDFIYVGYDRIID